MKIKLRSVLRTTDHLFDCFEDNQLIMQAGNTLCIKEINRNQSEFVCLSKDITKLYGFKSAPNHKHIFVAEGYGCKQSNNEKIEIASYSLKGDRKSFGLSESSSFFTNQTIDSIELLTDEFDSSLLYGAAKTKGDACLFLVDMNRNRIVCIGFISIFEDIVVNFKQNLTVSICGKGFVKDLTAIEGSWEINEKNIKKLPSWNIIKIIQFPGDRTVLCSRTQIFVMEGNDLLQTITVFQSDISSITKLLRIPKGFLIATEKPTRIKHYIEDSDELNFSLKQQVPIGNINGEIVKKMVLNCTEQQVILQTSDNRLQRWNFYSQIGGSDNLTGFCSIEYKHLQENSGSISMAAGKRFCLFGGNKIISLLDLQKNQPLLSTQYTSYDGGEDRIIYCSAINPDGNSFMVAFQDKLKVYQILLTTFKFVAEFSIKKCTNLVFSNGGQLIACRYGKGLNSSISIINTLQLHEVMALKLHSEPRQIIWSKLDEQLLISTHSNSVKIYKVAENFKLSTVQINQSINLIRIENYSNKLLVSTDAGITVVENGQVTHKQVPNIPNFNYVFPLHHIYFGADKTGTLFWSNSITFNNYSELPLFIDTPFQLSYRNNYMVAYSSYDNVTILQVSQLNKNKKIKGNDDIVFVERSSIQKLFQQFKVLQINFQNYQTATSMKLQEEKKKYDNGLSMNTENFTKQIKFMQKKMQQIQGQKTRQEKANERIFTDLQAGQVNSVVDIEQMFQRKLQFQKQKYMNLQQENLQQKINYQKIIFTLEGKYDREVALIRKQYDRKLQSEIHQLEQSKIKDLDYKQKMEFKFIDIEEENQVTLSCLQNDKDSVIADLRQSIFLLERKCDQHQVNLHNKEAQLKSVTMIFNKKQVEFQKNQDTIFENLNRIKMLDNTIITKNTMMMEKDSLIQCQNQQIDGLQKAKYVLSFRTSQIRKELEPKQTLIDKLKSQLFKLDDQFKLQLKKVFTLQQKIEKLTKIHMTAKKQNNEYKLNLKNKQKTYDQLCHQIFMIINGSDQKQWNNLFIKLYQSYIKQDNFKNRAIKKKDYTSEEINRHLIHVEQSLLQVSTGNDKVLKGKEKDVIRKMKQNAELVYDLNVMRKKQNQYLNEIKQKSNLIVSLKKDLHSFNKTSTRANTAHTGITRRVQSRDKQQRGNDFSGLDFSLKRDSDYLIPQRNHVQAIHRSRISSAHKTMFWKEDKREKGKIFDLARDFQSAKNTIRRQDRMIEQLNERLLGSPNILMGQMQ